MTDRESLRQRIILMDVETNKREKEFAKIRNKKAEAEKLAEIASVGVTRKRELEKEKLTKINITRQMVKDEQTHLKNHLQRSIIQSHSNEKLRTDRMEQVY